MLATSSELQIRAPQLQDPGGDLNQLVSLLRRRVSAGEPFAADSFIQEVNVYSAAPADLVRGHALGTDVGEGKGMAWYFCSPADYHQTPGARRRKRKVGGGVGGGGETCWHVEKGASILGPDKKSIGAYKRTLSYVQKIKNPPGSPKPFRNRTLGWIMMEIELEQQEGTDSADQQQLVLCKVYQSPGPRTEVCSVPGGDMPCAPAPPPAASKSSSSYEERQVTRECKTTLDYDLHSPGTARKPSLSIRPALNLKPATRCRPMKEKITCGVAIVKKGSATAAVTVVMKFGGSSMKSANQMKKMAELVFSFPEGEGGLVLVLSAMGNTTTNLLVAAGKALSCGAKEASKIHELAITKEMHFRMIDDLGLNRSLVSGSLDELERVIMAIALIEELTSKTRDYLVSFGENVSTRIFTAYLNKLGTGTCQEWESYAVKTCGRGGSDLTATTIACDLGSRELQVWKDVDGVLTCNPNVSVNALPLPYLTFDEATELGLFGAQSMQLATEGGMPVIVKNLCNPQAPGTIITKTRDMSKSVLTSIVLKSNITVLNIENTGMLDQSGFLAMSFSIFGKLGISVECVSISEGKISLIVVPSKLSSHELARLEIDNLVEELEENSVVDRLQDRSVISLIGNAQMSAIILEKSINVLRSINVEIQKFSQGSSKVMNISLVVDNNKGEDCVRALHSEFFEKGFVSQVQGGLNGSPVQAPENSPAAVARSGDKRKANDSHPEAPPSVRQQQPDTETQSPSNNHSSTIGGDNIGDPTEVFDSISDDNIHPVTDDHGWDPSMCYADMERLLSEEMSIRSDDIIDWSSYLSGVFDGGYNINEVLSRGNEGGGPSRVGAGLPEDDEQPPPSSGS